MRGKRPHTGQQARNIRITPADAGKTSHLRGLALRSEDHPRGCGENVLTLHQSKLDYRITPADAGKTCYLFYRHSGFWDHPRGCGENVELEHIEQPIGGSPPRMRGKLSLSLLYDSI